MAEPSRAAPNSDEQPSQFRRAESTSSKNAGAAHRRPGNTTI